MKNRIVSNIAASKRARMPKHSALVTTGVIKMLTASLSPFPDAIKLFVFWEVSDPAGSGCSTVHSAREFFAYYYPGYRVTSVSRVY
jgi:hypothetical protein